MNPSIISVLALFLNPVLLIAVVFLYGRNDERVKEVLYGTVPAVVVAVALGAFGLLSSRSLIKFSEVTIIIFLVAARTRLFLMPAPTGKNVFIFTLLGLALGLSPIFSRPVMFITGTGPSDLGGIYTALPLICLFLLSWLALTVRGRFFHPTLFLSGLIAANLPYVSRGLTGVAKTFVHDYYHLYSVVLLVPDHPYTRMWWYTTVDFILRPAFGAAIVLLLFCGPAISATRREIADFRARPWRSGPRGRAEKAAARAYQRRQSFFSLSVFLALALAIFADLPVDAAVESRTARAPIENDHVLVAETNPFTKIEKNRIVKYYVRLRGKKIVFNVLKAGDSYKAALDACAICGPTGGYSQLEGGVLKCDVCGSVLPLSSFGQSGGCNPVPLTAQQQPAGLTIKLKELEDEFMKASQNGQ